MCRRSGRFTSVSGALESFEVVTQPPQDLNQLVLIRHSEAEKTLRQVHGGLGTRLTSRGRADTVALAVRLTELKLYEPQTVIFTGPRPQAAETAELLSV